MKRNIISILTLLAIMVLSLGTVGCSDKEETRANEAQVRKSVDSPPGMLTEDHHHTVHEESQVCYSSHLRPKSLHL